MSDIVKRLREKIIVDAFVKGSISDGALCDRLIRERLDAADEIERLQIEIERLQEYVDYRDEGWRHGIDDCIAADIY